MGAICRRDEERRSWWTLTVRSGVSVASPERPPTATASVPELSSRSAGLPLHPARSYVTLSSMYITRQRRNGGSSSPLTEATPSAYIAGRPGVSSWAGRFSGYACSTPTGHEPRKLLPRTGRTA